MKSSVGILHYFHQTSIFWTISVRHMKQTENTKTNTHILQGTNTHPPVPIATITKKQKHTQTKETVNNKQQAGTHTYMTDKQTDTQTDKNKLLLCTTKC